METVTLGQFYTFLLFASGLITAIATPIIAMYRWYKKKIEDKFIAMNNRIDSLEKKDKVHEDYIQSSKDEFNLLIRGQLACLKGLKEQGCNGSVTQGINDIEEYLLQKSHE